MAILFSKVCEFQAKSEVNLAPEDLDTAMLLHEVSKKLRSRSLEHLSGLAIWNCVPIVVTLEKDSRGLGFSIVDYKVKFRLKFGLSDQNKLDTHEMLDIQALGWRGLIRKRFDAILRTSFT